MSSSGTSAMLESAGTLAGCGKGDTVRLGYGDRLCVTASGDCTRESGGDMGSSGRSSRNFDCVRTGVPDRCRMFRWKATGGG